MGEMLFTHFGLSGPLVLSASAHMRGDVSSYTMSIDLKPALTEHELDSRLISDLTKYSVRDFSNSLGDLLPQKLIGEIILRCGIDSHKKCAEITKAERGALLAVLKSLTFHPVAFRPIDEAIITSGGIDIKNIDPKTMMSKDISGLFFAGEVIDVDAYTGGYNLQIAFSTGAAAGRGAARFAANQTTTTDERQQNNENCN